MKDFLFHLVNNQIPVSSCGSSELNLTFKLAPASPLRQKDPI